MNMTEEKRVGPIIRGVDGELCDAVINAIEDDNPGADVEVDDQGGYVKITTPRRCRLTRASSDLCGRQHKDRARREEGRGATARGRDEGVPRKGARGLAKGTVYAKAEAKVALHACIHQKPA